MVKLSRARCRYRRTLKNDLALIAAFVVTWHHVLALRSRTRRRQVRVGPQEPGVSSRSPVVVVASGHLRRFHHFLVLASSILKPYFDLQQKHRLIENLIDVHADIRPIYLINSNAISVIDIAFLVSSRPSHKFSANLQTGKLVALLVWFIFLKELWSHLHELWLFGGYSFRKRKSQGWSTRCHNAA
jgi:hypothetical protein